MIRTFRRHVSLLIITALCLQSLAFSQQPPPRQKVFGLDELLGKWKLEMIGDGVNQTDEVTIKAKDGRPGTLTLEATHADWEGTYSDGVLQLTRRPAAEEMSSKAPPWARQQVAREGTLKWLLKLTPREDCKGPILEGSWYQGELSWEEKIDPRTGQSERHASGKGTGGGPEVRIVYRKIDEGPTIDGVVVVEDQLASEKATNQSGDRGLTFPYQSANDASGSVARHRTLFIYGRHLLKDKTKPVQPQSPTPSIGYRLLMLDSDFDRAGTGMKALWKAGIRGMGQTAVGPNPGTTASTKDLDMLLVQADLASGVLPGLKDITLNTAQGSWFLKVGSTRATINFVRPIVSKNSPNTPLSAVRTEKASEIFLPERVMVEIRAEAQTDLQEVPVVVRNTGPPPTATEGNLSVVARRISDNEVSTDNTRQAIYRTDPIQIREQNKPRQPPGSGALEIPAKPKDKLVASLEQSGLLFVNPPVVEATVLRSPADVNSLWREYLYKAAQSNPVEEQDGLSKISVIKSLPEDEITKISNYYLVGGKVLTVKVHLGNIAAAMLLRDTFIKVMKVYQSDVAKIQLDDSNIRGFRNLIRAYMKEPNFPLARVEVADPIKSLYQVKVQLRDVFDEGYLQQKFGDLQVRKESYQLAAVKEGLDEYKKAVDYSIKKAEGTGDGDIKGLLALIHSGFDPVVSRALPRLVTLDDSNPSGPVWVPDQDAMKWVQTTPGLAAQVWANRELGSADTQFLLGIALMIPAITEAGLLASVLLNVANAADFLARQLPEYRLQSDEAKLALGAQGALGTDRLDMARLEETPFWGTMVSGVGAGIGLGADVLAALPKASVSMARAAAPHVLEQFEKGGIQALRQMSKNDQLQFYVLLADARAAQAAGKSLTLEQRAALTAAEQFRQELEIVDRTGILSDFRPATGDTELLGRDASHTDYVFGKDNNGKDIVLPLGDYIGAGATSTVFGDAASSEDVIKIVRKAGWDVDTFEQIVNRLSKTDQKLKDAGIEHLPIKKGVAQKDRAYLIQERLRPEPGGKVKILHRDEFSDGIGMMGPCFKPYAEINKVLTEGMQRALLRLFKKLADNGHIWLDCKWDNVYFKTRNGEWVAGILDQDLIVSVKDIETNNLTATQRRFVDSLRTGGSQFPIFSSNGQVPLTDPHFAMEKLLEGKGWVRLNPFTREVEGLLDPKIVDEFFPNFSKDLGLKPKPRVPGTGLWPAKPPRTRNPLNGARHVLSMLNKLSYLPRELAPSIERNIVPFLRENRLAGVARRESDMAKAA